MTDIVYNKNGVPFDIDAIATDLNGKMDKDGVNAECPTLLSRTPNSQGGVTEIWSDGYCIVTGKTAGTLENNHFYINLPVEFTTVNFNWIGQPHLGVADTGSYYIRPISPTGVSNRIYYFVFLSNSITTNNAQISYRAEGYIR